MCLTKAILDLLEESLSAKWGSEIRRNDNLSVFTFGYIMIIIGHTYHFYSLPLIGLVFLCNKKIQNIITVIHY